MGFCQVGRQRYLFVAILFEFDIDDLEELCFWIKVGKGCIDSIEQSYMAIDKTVAKLLNLIGTARYCMNSGRN